jgi:UDP-N-acetylmuramate--alanine ligase
MTQQELQNLIFKSKHVHFMGIKGVAMTSLAQCFTDLGITVTGSDVDESFVTQTLLDSLHIKITPLTQNPPHCDLLVYTGAHQGKKNPQVQWAMQQNIPVIAQSDALGALALGKSGIAVCGVGGKSTTSAMITWLLEKTHQNISYSVGVGEIIGLPRTGKYVRESEYFVYEADEYSSDPSVKGPARFLSLYPSTIVMTQVVHDHPDVYPTFEDTKQAYQQFLSHLPKNGHVVCKGSSDDSVEVLQSVCQQGWRCDFILPQGETLSHHVEDIICSQKTIWQIQSYSVVNQKATIRYTKSTNMTEVRSFTLSVPGSYNAVNALMAIASLSNEQDSAAYETAIASFHSTKRRLEYMRQKDNVTWLDDYAHHPTEIQATIQALREWYPDHHLTVIFQPHTFSRTKMFFHEFSRALSNADIVFIPDIFASAREAFDPSVTSEQLAHETKNAVATGTLQKTAETVRKHISQMSAPAVVVTIGAGDVYHLHSMVE